MPKNDRVAALATVRCRWPGTQAVLWITRLMLYEALVIPPMPPNRKRMPARSWATTEGSPHGRARIQPSSPLPPRARPAYSNDAITVNAVSIEGKKTE
jgi:hypothetical protein